MSNPFSSYSHHTQSSYGSDHLDVDSRQHRSHWSAEFDKTASNSTSNSSNNNKNSNFVEKFSPPSSSRSYSPSLSSNNAYSNTNANAQLKQETGYNAWPQRESQYSEIGSLPSYHDSPELGGRSSELRMNKVSAFRKSLDTGNRARVYLFIAMMSSMMLLFLFTALIWLALGIIKKPLVYGLDNKASFSTRPA